MLIRSLSFCLICSVFGSALADAPQVVVQGLFADKAVVMINGKPKVLNKDKMSSEGLLLIEADSQKAIIEVDGVRETYYLDTNIGNKFSLNHSAKSLILNPDSRGHYYVTGYINSLPVDFLVDTGATSVSMNSHVAKRLGIDYKLIGEKGISSTASGRKNIYKVKLDSVRLGDIELHHVGAAVSDGDFPEITLLGMSFLGRLQWQYDGLLLKIKQRQ